MKKIPPVLLLLINGALMWLVAQTNFAYPFAGGYSPLVASILVLVGLGIGLSAVREFRRVQTTVNPMRPENATTLVDSGVFAFSRNPMYLGLALVLAGWGTWLGSAGSFAVIVLFVIAITALQIRPEEAALAKCFGDDYVKYRQRVRRWI
tara:strand:- start:21332 stop:21781 length:450 start_codon:yes stop_codon:yes gene_type:complete